jgi:hypothetical protein
VVDTMVTPADGFAEVDAALVMAERLPGGRITIEIDKYYDQRRLITTMRAMAITVSTESWELQFPGEKRWGFGTTSTGYLPCNDRNWGHARLPAYESSGRYCFHSS